MCGSFCTHEKVLAELEKLVQLYETVIPIASEISAFTDTRFVTSRLRSPSVPRACWMFW